MFGFKKQKKLITKTTRLKSPVFFSYEYVIKTKTLEQKHPLIFVKLLSLRTYCTRTPFDDCMAVTVDLKCRWKGIRECIQYSFAY